jgi:hypothetical protein
MHNHSEFISEMRAALVRVGTLRVSEEGPLGEVALLTGDGRNFTFEAPLAGIIEGVSVNDLEIMAHPDDETPLIGQLRLFAIHVEEAIDTWEGGVRLLEFTKYGVETK